MQACHDAFKNDQSCSLSDTFNGDSLLHGPETAGNVIGARLVQVWVTQAVAMHTTASSRPVLPRCWKRSSASCISHLQTRRSHQQTWHQHSKHQLACLAQHEDHTNGLAAPQGAVQQNEDAANQQSPSPRRTLQVTFTCNKCGKYLTPAFSPLFCHAFIECSEPHIRSHHCHAGGRTERLVNPVAWEKGLIFAQCGSCEAWHKLRDECSMVEEIRYIDEPT